ncbi:MAG TPA: TMEM165/GDT1 family protein [Symbiobacteriaceae bacterium]|nr:TMEM165/GDT1 family protein [Symbiobacteriaceae bacterium]
MDWKSGLLAFAIIFAAELGDKTQLVIMSMSAGSRSPQMVFFGSAVALIASSLVAVLAGDFVLRNVPVKLVHLGTGVAFLVIGGALLLKSLR